MALKYIYICSQFAATIASKKSTTKHVQCLEDMDQLAVLKVNPTLKTTKLVAKEKVAVEKNPTSKTKDEFGIILHHT